MDEPVPIIGGTGALGYGLALRWARQGTRVVIGSRKPERAAEAAERVRAAVPEAPVEGLPNDEAARSGPIVFLTVPFRAQSETVNNLREVLKPGQLLVDCTVPLAAALQSVSAPVLADLDAELAEDVLVCGDRKADKARVAQLVGRIPGLRAVNAGPLEMARISEQLTPLLISINARYKAHAGIRITGLPDDDHWG